MITSQQESCWFVVAVEVFMGKASGHSPLLLPFSIQCYRDLMKIQYRWSFLCICHFSRYFLLTKSIPAPFHPVFYCHVTWYQLWANEPCFKSQPPAERKNLSVWSSPSRDSKPSDHPWLSWYGLFSKPHWDTDHLTANKIIGQSSTRRP